MCTLLETCGSVFSRGALTKRLDAFLVYLQVYVKTKIEPPLDIVFLLQDTFEALRPNARRFQSFEEALEALKEVTQASAAVEASGGQEDELSEDEEDVAEGTRGSDTDDSGSDISDERSDGVGTGSDSAEENVVVRDQFAKGPSKEEDDEFEKELNKILQESVESRRSEKRVMNLFDVAVPLGNMRRGKFTVGADDEGARSSGDEEDHGGKGSVVFSILTKKGNKQQVNDLSFVRETPSDRPFYRT